MPLPFPPAVGRSGSDPHRGSPAVRDERAAADAAAPVTPRPGWQLRLAASGDDLGLQIVAMLLIAVLLALHYLLWIAEDGVRQTYALRVAIQAQSEENAALNERNRAMEADIQDLKTGMTAIEERARAEMGMIRGDETFYRILEQPVSPPPASPSGAHKSAPAAKPAAKPATRPAAPPSRP
ncbi:MAG TPA: cell division protein FtsB [Candidatus Competibacteraceae bacterium]|nr:cell division protein FtsB [Candidatus Competibacteraceae bacterium]